MGKSLIRFRIDQEKKDRFQQYCNVHNISMTDAIISRIDELIEVDQGSDEVVLPGAEKNSVESTPDPPKYQYCTCGIDLMTLSVQDRIQHIQNCTARRK